MSTDAAQVRTKWRAYLLLSRVSNLPTIWSNVLAGMAAAGSMDLTAAVRASVGISLMYTAGMFLNDLADEQFDRRHRTDRPIPHGDVSRSEVAITGLALLASGGIVVAAAGSHRAALPWLLALAAAIVFYDYHHKQNAFGPLVMGTCRGLVYCVAAAAAVGFVDARVLVAAAGLVGYVVALTFVAKRLGPRGGVAVPLLLAGISLVDAIVVIASGGGVGLALLAACGFPLTLMFQRIVPGT